MPFLTNLLLGCLILIEGLNLFIHISEYNKYEQTFSDAPPLDDDMIKRLYS